MQRTATASFSWCPDASSVKMSITSEIEEETQLWCLSNLSVLFFVFPDSVLLNYSPQQRNNIDFFNNCLLSRPSVHLVAASTSFTLICFMTLASHMTIICVKSLPLPLEHCVLSYRNIIANVVHCLTIFEIIPCLF